MPLSEQILAGMFSMTSWKSPSGEELLGLNVAAVSLRILIDSASNSPRMGLNLDTHKDY